MVWGHDTPGTAEGKLTDHDWELIGRQRRRIDVPPPNDRDGILDLASRFARLSQELYTIARGNPRTRSAILEAMHEVEHMNAVFLTLNREWRAAANEAIETDKPEE